MTGSAALIPRPQHQAARFSLPAAYATSAAEIARCAKDLDRGAFDLSLGPVAIQALVGDIVQDLAPKVHNLGLALLRDADSRCDGVCCADPGQLRRVLNHLLLRALQLEPAPGHVRVLVTLAGHKAHILILSRAPEPTPAANTGDACEDLAASRRLLQAMGGSLVLEPRRAGYLALCMALPALSAAPALRAA